MQELIVHRDSQKISIQPNRFWKQKKELQAFSREIPSSPRLPTASNASTLSFLGRDRVTSADVNKLANAIQEEMIQQNKHIVKIIKEFEVVYNTFNSLDQEYVQEIVRSFNVAVGAQETANQNILWLNEQQQEIEKDQKDIKTIVNNLKTIVDVLKDFKEKLEKIEHLVDIDAIFSDVEENQNQLNSVFQLASKQKAHTEQLLRDVNAKIIQLDQKHCKALTELKSEVEGKAQRIEKQYEIMVSMLDGAVNQLREEVNQKFYIALSEACVASQTITWN